MVSNIPSFNVLWSDYKHIGEKVLFHFILALGKKNAGKYEAVSPVGARALSTS